MSDSASRSWRPPRQILWLLLAFTIGGTLAGALVWYLTPQPVTKLVSAPTPHPKPLPELPRPDTDPSTLSAREDMLAARLAALEQRTQATTTAADAAAFNATRAEGLMVAFAARRAIDRGLGLGYLERELQERFGSTQPAAVAAVLRAAREPVTVEDLRASMETLGPDLAFAPGTDGWWTAFTRELGSLIILRREGTPSPSPTERLARIKRLLEQRQVEPAMTEASRLPGASQASRWMAAARRWIDAHRALDLIDATAITGNAGPAMPQRAQPLPEG